MNEKTKTYAKLAQASYKFYNKKPIENIDGYELIPEYSDKNSTLFFNPENNEFVLSIRGTDLLNSSDIANDILQYENKLSESSRVTDIVNKVKEIYNNYITKYEKMRFILVGHSLGGSLSYQVLRYTLDYIDDVYMFNSFTTSATLRQNLLDTINCTFRSTKQCKTREKINKKLHIYTNGDPLSIFSLSYGKADKNFVKPESINAHSISNFTGGMINFDNATMIKPFHFNLNYERNTVLQN